MPGRAPVGSGSDIPVEGASRPTRPPTIRDVAALAGVSKSLVSRVVRGQGNVGPARQALVEKAMQELGYRPNRLAQSLSESRSDTVGVLLNDLRNPWFVDLLEGLTATLDAVGVAPVLADSRLDRRVGRDTVERFLRARIDGLVVVGTTEEQSSITRAAAVVPVVLAGTHEPDLEGVDVVADDDIEGGRIATRHLLELGHVHIAYLEGPGIVGALRRQGFLEAMSAAGLAEYADVVPGGMAEESGYAAASRVLDRADARGRPTALLAFNDVTAVGALSAAADRGLDVPGDVSVIGYDDTYLSRIRRISLTTMDNGSYAVGALAGRYLLDRIAKPGGPARRHLHTPSLVIRATTSSPSR